jgi:hypothetical protein
MKTWSVRLYYRTGKTQKDDEQALVVISAESGDEAGEQARKFMKTNHPEFDDSKFWLWLVRSCPGHKDDTTPRIMA